MNLIFFYVLQRNFRSAFEYLGNCFYFSIFLTYIYYISSLTCVKLKVKVIKRLKHKQTHMLRFAEGKL